MIYCVFPLIFISKGEFIAFPLIITNWENFPSCLGLILIFKIDESPDDIVDKVDLTTVHAQLEAIPSIFKSSFPKFFIVNG